MKARILPLLLLSSCTQASPEDVGLPRWSDAQLASLRHWLDAAPRDGLPRPDSTVLDAAIEDGNAVATSQEATALAVNLARAHLLGCAAQAERRGWFIADTDDPAPLRAGLEQALASGGNLDAYYSGLQPENPDYAALRSALAGETDPARRATIARNLDRWRWLPQALEGDRVVVNVPAFEVGLWRGGTRVRSWPAVVGKPATPTPAFNATISGVIFNPWWELPPSIVREMSGRLSSRRGYVRSGGRWRQRPGPGNSLGQMKLAMPNRYNVYLHDTPSKGLFGHASRAYSHGCVRVEDAIGFAETLLRGAKPRSEIDRLLAAGEPVTVPLPGNLPVYVAYFTASPGASGSVAYHPDVYGRDMAIADPTSAGRTCGTWLAGPDKGPAASP